MSGLPILWHSNSPTTTTGYGQQTAQVCRRLRDAGYDVAISCFYGVEGTLAEWEGIKLYPTDHTRFGKLFLPFLAKDHAGPERDPRDVLVITLMDSWVLTDAAKGLEECNLACWAPVDHDPLPPLVRQALVQTSARPIAMSKFGEAQMQAAGLDPLYVPHAIDTQVFRPLGARAECRRLLKLPEDAFVIGMVANNKGWRPPRKAFPQVMQAFSLFIQEHPDAYLYLHTELFGFDDGLNMMSLAAMCGIPEQRLATTDQLALHLGVPAEQMAVIYNAFDVLASPSYGEGFGIPIIEAQACGCPVITTNWTAMPELTAAGWLCEGDPWYDGGQGSFYMCPAVSQVLDALEAAYAARDDQELRQRAVEFAQQYDADSVFERGWLPILDELQAPREIGALA